MRILLHLTNLNNCSSYLAVLMFCLKTIKMLVNNNKETDFFKDSERKFESSIFIFFLISVVLPMDLQTDGDPLSIKSSNFLLSPI